MSLLRITPKNYYYEVRKLIVSFYETLQKKWPEFVDMHSEAWKTWNEWYKNGMKSGALTLVFSEEGVLFKTGAFQQFFFWDCFTHFFAREDYVFIEGERGMYLPQTCMKETEYSNLLAVLRANLKEVPVP